MRAPAGPILQRYAQREPLQQSLAYIALLQDRGWSCLAVGAAFLIVRLLDGAVFARMNRPRALDVGLLETVAARTGVSEVLVEPALRVALTDRDERRDTLRFDAAPQDYRARLTGLGWNPAIPKSQSKVMICDLSGGPDGVLPSLGATARRNVRVAHADGGVRYETVPFAAIDEPLHAELDALAVEFYRTHPDIGDSRALWRGFTRHFDRSGDLITARDDDALLGAIYMPRHDRVAHYYAAISTVEARARRVPTGLVYTAMRSAAAAGCDLFDFGAMWDARFPERAKSWKGFSRFKARFGGQAIELPPSYLAASAAPIEA